MSEEILSTEFSAEFVEGMKNRMVVSFYKYGKLTTAYPHKVDALGSLVKRLEEYQRTGNTEFLIDAANFAMIEFMHPRRAGAHFQPTDSDQSPGRRVARTGQMTHQSNDEIGRNHRSKTAPFRE